MILKKNEAEVSGLRKAIQGFGSAMNFAQYQMVKQLAPALREIFASDDSEFSKLFSSYMTPSPPSQAAKAQAPAPGT